MRNSCSPTCPMYLRVRKRDASLCPTLLIRYIRNSELERHIPRSSSRLSRLGSRCPVGLGPPNLQRTSFPTFASTSHKSTPSWSCHTRKRTIGTHHQDIRPPRTLQEQLPVATLGAPIPGVEVVYDVPLAQEQHPIGHLVQKVEDMAGYQERTPPLALADDSIL
mgnify:CR=1 FL=1